jgi:pyruvate,water dikinase
VFLLTVPEILGFVEGSATTANLKSLAVVRRMEAEADARRPDPPERMDVTGAVRAHSPAPAAAPEAQAGSERKGTGCSAGRVRGRARVVRDPAGESLAPGEILVARHTDPGWIALFANAAAIVVERGSLLSHSAIVARELAIPCVVGLKGAMDWIASGDLIELDGETGRVTKVEAPASEEAA